METLKTPSEYSVDFNQGFQEFSMANLEKGYMGLVARKPREKLSSAVYKHTGRDQPAHPRSLLSAFVIRSLENFICKPATGEISIF